MGNWRVTLPKPIHKRVASPNFLNTLSPPAAFMENNNKLPTSLTLPIYHSLRRTFALCGIGFVLFVNVLGLPFAFSEVVKWFADYPLLPLTTLIESSTFIFTFGISIYLGYTILIFKRPPTVFMWIWFTVTVIGGLSDILLLIHSLSVELLTNSTTFGLEQTLRLLATTKDMVTLYYWWLLIKGFGFLAAAVLVLVYMLKDSDNH